MREISATDGMAICTEEEISTDNRHHFYVCGRCSSGEEGRKIIHRDWCKFNV